MAEDDERILATVVRSPLNDRVWVPFIADGDHYSSAYAGSLSQVKAYVEVRCDTFDWRWRHSPSDEEDTWTLVER